MSFVLAVALIAMGTSMGLGPAEAASPLTKVTSVATDSSNHSCAVLSNGQARCWGDNTLGQLGDGTFTNSAVPVTVKSGAGRPLTGVVSIATGVFHTCALLSNGQARCWGGNSSGQLGDGTTNGSQVAVTVVSASGGPALSGIVSLSLGSNHSCAVLSSGQARCWGNNFTGELGDGSSSDSSSVPVAVVSSAGGPALTGITGLGVGERHSCVSLTSGEARCWGVNFAGALGDGTITNSRVPVTVVSSPDGPPLGDVAAVVAGSSHSCALLSTAEARCWGNNFSGELGDGTNIARPTPVPVVSAVGGPALTGIRSLAAGDNHSCALLTTGQARCWGFNFFGELGDGTTSEGSPVPVTVVTSAGGPALTGITNLAAGFRHSCARLSNGQARCWGRNVLGQLGDGTLTDSSLPVTVVRG